MLYIKKNGKKEIMDGEQRLAPENLKSYFKVVKLK